MGKTRWNFALILIIRILSLFLTFEFSRICLCHTQKHAQKKAHTRTRTHRFSSNTRATRSHREIPCTTWARARAAENHPFLCARRFRRVWDFFPSLWENPKEKTRKRRSVIDDGCFGRRGKRNALESGRGGEIGKEKMCWRINFWKEEEAIFFCSKLYDCEKERDVFFSSSSSL